MTDIASFELIHIGEYWALFRREKWRALGVGCAIMAAGVAALAVWPPTYRSTATILIEEADIPPELVMSTVSAFASERIQAIQQRVITTANLIGIINKFNLYADQRESVPMTQVAEEMQPNITLSILSADAAAKGGRDTRAAIAFTLSFDAESALVSQQVTSELSSLFLSESQRDRDQRATGTASFLESESDRLHSEVEVLESRLETFRTENAGYLPEDRPVNQQLLDRADSQLLDLTREIQTLRDRQGIIRAQLAKTSAQLPAASAGPSLSPADQLALLEAKRTELSARYGAQHPDVLAIDRQISALKSQTGVTGINTSALKLQVQTLQDDLQNAKQRYGAKHPDTLKLERELKAAQDQLAAAPPVVSQSASNPDYVQLQVELASLNAEIDAALVQQRATEEKKTQMEERILKSPTIERDYVALKRDYDTAVAKYLDLRSKTAEAEITQNLETKRMGETLTLIEPPTAPLAPIKPNRLAILAVAALAAVAGGIATGVLHDAADGRIHGWRQLAGICGQTPFAVVPLIQTANDRHRRRQAMLLQLLLLLLLCAAVLAYVNAAVVPLDVVWADMAGRLGLAQDGVTLSPK